MKGLELARKYFEEAGLQSINEQFKNEFPFLAFGLVGSGSECYGFDDEFSKDHDFEPGFCIFIPDEDVIDRKTVFELERAYSKLPNDFCGFKRNKINPVGGNRHGVIKISDFYNNKIGNPSGKLSSDEWLRLPDYALFEAVNGEVFLDNYGLFSSIRENIMNMPDDIRLKKAAGNLLIMAQSGQYNYNRCILHGETAAAQLAVFDFVKSGMQLIFILNKKYMPYYKWSFRALKNLPVLSNLSDSFEYLISNDNKYSKLKAEIIEDISNLISNELVNQKITDSFDSELERTAYKVNDKIKDSYIRNLNIFIGT